MKIALINHWPPCTGVGGRFLELFEHMLQNSEVEADLFYTNYVNIGKVSREASPRIHFLNKMFYTRPLLFHQFLKYFVHPITIPKFYDLYHISDEMIAVFAKFNRPSVITFHGPIFVEHNDRMPKPFTLYKRFLQHSHKHLGHADKIVCISDRSRDDLTKNFPTVADRAKVIHFGVDQDLFRPRDQEKCRRDLGLPVEKRIILNVGNEMRRKNIPNLLKAIYKLKKRVDNLLLIRIGNRLKSTEELIESLGLENNVLHIRRVPKQKIAYFYNAADLYVLPSYNECLAFSSIEAIASGCPVISSELATPEILRDVEVLFNPFRFEDIARKMERVLTDQNLREELIKKGLDRCIFFSWEKCIKENIQMYKEILN